jgi:hypothetical protein
VSVDLPNSIVDEDLNEIFKGRRMIDEDVVDALVHEIHKMSVVLIEQFIDSVAPQRNEYFFGH